MPKYLALLVLITATATPFARASDTDKNQHPEADDVERIEIKGRAQSLYRRERNSLATRTDTPLAETPQAVQLLPRELIEDQAARQISDLYRSISGVSNFSYSGVTFRGFRQDEILYDGVRGDPFNGFAVPQLFNIQQIEVLKGPAGALYGSGQPGGLVNYATKKPSRQPYRRLELSAGNRGFFGGGLELSGPFGAGERWRYRLGAYLDTEEPFRYNTELDNRIVDLGLARDLGEATTVTLQLTDIEQDYQGARLRGVPVDDDGHFLTTRRWNHNEATDFQNLEATVGQLRLDHRFNQALATDVTLRYYDNTELQNYHEPFGLLDTDGDGQLDWSTRQFRDQRRDNEAWSVTANLSAAFATGNVAHTLLFGGDAFKQDSDFTGRNGIPEELGGEVPGLALHDPVYGLTSGADYRLDTLPTRFTHTESIRQGLYIQDQIEFSQRWNLLAGVRWDRFDDSSDTGAAVTEFDDDGFSYRIGTTFEATDGIRLYAVHGTGFVPQNAGNQDPRAGGPFDPEESQLWEAGMKTHLFNDRVALNAAVYRIVRENILQPDPALEPGDDGVQPLAPIGEVNSDGFELDLLGDLTPVWVMNLSYAYNDARITEATGSITNAVGKRFVNAPRHQAGLWTRYDFPAIRSAIAGGAEYVDERISFSGQKVRAYTIFDISWQTRVADWLFQLNVKNLFDREYAVSGFLDRTGHFPGEPRRVYLSARYDF